MAFDLGRPESEPSLCSIYITSRPSTTFPNTVCFPFNQGQGTKVMKNWEPFVLGPAFAIERRPG